MSREVTPRAPAANSSANQWPPEVAALLSRTATALDAEGPSAALEVLDRARAEGPWAINARGVCLMRLGDPQTAIRLFRGLVLGTGVSLREDAPSLFKANYATAQLLTGNLTGCIITLAQTQDETHPSVQRLRAAISRWERGMSFWERVRYYLVGGMPRPVELDFPPGEV